MGYIPHKETMNRGTLFHSELEAQYYEYLIQQEDISNIKLQPEFILLEPFTVSCYKCNGSGRVPGKRGTRQCSRCTGTGKKQRQQMIYTADFKVIYKDGREEIIDVKGNPKLDKQFPLRKKLFEARYKQELIVVTKNKKGEWVRK